MSRIGKTPILVPKGVTFNLNGTNVSVQGPKGSLELEVPSEISVKQEGDIVTIGTVRNDKRTKALHGFVRAQLANYVQGVTQGWSKSLEMAGVGYRAALSGANLVLTVGFSHSVTIEPPKGIQFSIVDAKIVVTGIDKQEVGQTAATIRAVKEPEPYKGKGIKYVGERIRKKAGKSAKAVGGGGAK